MSTKIGSGAKAGSLVPRPHPQEGEGLVAFERFLGLLRIIRKAILNQLEVFEIVLLLAKLSQKNITQTKETRGDTQNSTILMLVMLGVA